MLQQRLERSKLSAIGRALGLTVVAICSALLGAAACGSNNDITETEATETNFFSIACRSDADCVEGRFCELGPESDAPDAGERLGRCLLPPPPG